MSVARCLSSSIMNEQSGVWALVHDQQSTGCAFKRQYQQGRRFVLLRLRKIAVLLTPTVALAAASVPTPAAAHALLLGGLGAGLFGGHGFGGGAFGHGFYNRYNGFNGYGGYNGYTGYGGYNGYAGYGGAGYAWGPSDYGYGYGGDCDSEGWGPYGWR